MSASMAPPSRRPASPAGRIGARLAHPLLAAAVVFGAPSLYCIVCAIRGRLLLGHHLYGAAGSAAWGPGLWGVAAGLGAAWLGVSLRLGLAPRLTPARRKTSAGGLIVTGAAMLFLSARLLGPMVAA